tara:strand:- start:1219 stop:2250 length:1032 start_codon:yes stop_codon:yes gene_type:complete
MEINFTKYRINLKYSFGISRSSDNYYDVAFVFIKDNGIIGRGEAAPSKRYGESIDYIIKLLESGISLPKNCYDKESVWKHIKPQLGGIKSLEAAFNMAIWDWWGQKQKKPVYELFNIKVNNLPKTSFTIAIGKMNEIERKIEEAKPYSILKVKLGTPKNDKNIITQIRKLTDKIIRVDANEGWDLDMAINMSKWLADRNVEFIEQPFPASKIDQTSILKKKSPLDIFADENSINSNDIPNLKGVFDGINIKLMKCGSIEEGYKMIKLAREFDLKIMLGCMVESSIGITAASHLAGFVDFIDLDGNILISNDPYEGVKVIDGFLHLSSISGLGLKLNNKNKELL